MKARASAHSHPWATEKIFR